MAPLSGFEGFEKRLELQFSGDDDDPLGLRRIPFESLSQVLTAVQCTVVSAVANRFFDAYVLSESSLFVYPHKIIIKTCGTTHLLRSIPSLIPHTTHLGLHLCSCRYTRGSFLFPEAQPFPHTSFQEEVNYLEEALPSSLCFRKACVLPSSNISSHSWHVYSATTTRYHKLVPSTTYTVEVCMTQLDETLARRFFRRAEDQSSGEFAGKEMTESTGIGDINPKAMVCDFAFDPCGYSMNGVDEDRYSTVHVTPEDGYSYASFECIGVVMGGGDEIPDMMKRVVRVFRPGTMSVSVFTDGDGWDERPWSAVADAVRPLGLSRRSQRVEELPGAGTIMYQTFTSRRR